MPSSRVYIKKAVRNSILDTGIRPDGRDPKTIRPITSAVGVLPRTHGTGLFTRGETQVLTIATLGTPRDAQMLDNLSPEETKRYMHHYNFPPFSTGETWPMRGPKRREIGHGALAERALEPVIPDQDEFPYTLRLVSECLSSNGSTSMASVCGSTLALMDAGVPITAPVAGIAMGLISEGDVTQSDSRYVVLTDIQGMEDHLGDMDFKVAGTEAGITALQMDIKIKGLSYELLDKALEQAHTGRLHILGKMLEVLPEARARPLRVCAPHPHHPDRSRKNRQDHRPWRQDHPRHPRPIMTSRSMSKKMARSTSLAAPTAEKALEEIELMTEGSARSARFTPARSSASNPTALLSKSCPAPTAWCTSRSWPITVSPVSKMSCNWATRSWSWSSTIEGDTGKIRLSRQAVLEGWTAEEALARDRKPSGGRSGGGRGRDNRSGGRRNDDRRRR